MEKNEAITTEWPADPSLYNLVTKIGSGAFATVWKAERKDTDCAVKVLNLDAVDTNLAEIRQEVQSMRLLLHPNVLPCHTAFVNNRDLWLITPIMRKGSSLHSLQTVRRHYRHQSSEFKPPPMEPHILYILHETLLGLQYIHENGQIHRDIKAGNILVDTDGAVKIADFGVSGWLGVAQGNTKAQTFVGTPCWMSPEVMEQVHGYDYKADVWSVGITALELAKGYAPYAKYPPMRVLILTIQEEPPSLASYEVEDTTMEDSRYDMEVQEEYSALFSTLVGQCLQKNPAKRPTCPNLLASKHFAPFAKEEYRRQQRQALASQVCALVPDVSSSSSHSSGRRPFPGNAPVSIVTSAEDRQKGTTWVFQDGSQVLSSTAANKKSVEVEDVLAEWDEFAEQTGGEKYGLVETKTAATTPRIPPENNGNQQRRTEKTSDDDLDDFLDDFEQNHAAGENFRRSGC